MKARVWEKVIMFAVALALSLSMLTACSKPKAEEPAPPVTEAPGVTFETSSDVIVDLSGGSAADSVTGEEVPN